MPVQVRDLNDGVTAIAAGDSHSCAIQDGSVQCWGSGRTGELGDGNISESFTPVQVEGLRNDVTMIAAGEHHTCAIINTAAQCWGSNSHRQLGDSSQSQSLTPISVQGLDDGITAIAAGGDSDSGHSCAIHYGITKCWGSDSHGQLGDGSANTADTYRPVQSEGLVFAGPTQLMVDAVRVRTIIVSWTAPANTENVPVTNYRVSWGTDLEEANSFNTTSVAVSKTSYQIDGLSPETSYQIAVVAVNRGGISLRSNVLDVQTLGQPPMVTAKTLSAGSAHSCAVYNDAAWCWGLSDNGRLGVSTDVVVNGRVPIPHRVQGLNSNVTVITAGNLHSCAIQNNAAWCWGKGSSGQLGDGRNTDSTGRVQVRGLNSSVTAIAAGDRHTCAIHDGGVKCWGEGNNGRLGNGLIVNSSVSVAVDGLDGGVTAIATESAHTCAVQDGRVKCWGESDSGRLGYDGTEDLSTPRQVLGLDDGATAIATGERHSCAVVQGAVQCWGRGDEGQLGDGKERTSSTPVSVKGLNSGVTAIAAGWIHTCAIVNAAAQCWGFNQRGQLGNDSRVQSSVAVAVRGLNDGVTEIAAGGAMKGRAFGHSCAIHYDSVKCWGSNSHGQLGDNSGMNFDIPVQARELAPPLPAAPLQLVANVVTAHSIAISWAAPTGVENVPIVAYIVSWGTDLVNTNNFRTTSVSAATTRYLIEDLNADTVYRIAVAAMNPSGTVRSDILVSATQAESPTAPTQLDLGAIMTDSITVRWQPPENTGGAKITEYIVYWGETIQNSSQSQSVLASARDYSINNLTRGVVYQITVVAVNRVGPGPRANILERMISLTRPGEPISVTGNIVTTDHIRFDIHLSWTPPSDDGGTPITGYNVGTFRDGVRTTENILNPLQTNYVLENVQLNTDYLFHIYAVNSFDIGPPSRPLNQIVNRSAPQAPTGLTAAVMTDDIRVDWVAPSDDGGTPIMEYNLYWLEVDAATVNTERITNPLQTNYVLENVQLNKSYQITVAAVNRVGEGVLSETLEVQALPPLLPAPTDLIARAVTADGIGVGWTASVNADGTPITGITEYIVYWRVASINGMESSVSITGESLQTSYVISELEAETNYEITVAAVNEYGIGPRSAPLLQQTLPLPAPTDLIARAVTTDGIGVGWTASVNADGTPITGIIGYAVYWHEASGGTETREDITDPLQTSYVIEGLQPNTSYRISVVAVNRGGEGVRSETLEVQTLPLLPANLIADAVTVDLIRVSWTAPVGGDGTPITGITGYTVYWREAPSGTETRVDITNPLQTSHVIRELEADRMYEVTVAAVAGTYTGPMTAPLVVNLADLTATAAQPTTAMPALAAGTDHNCVIVDGTAKCWGSNKIGNNRRGPLGDGSGVASRDMPVDVKNLEFGVTSIAAGDLNSCAIQNGAAKCWGDNVRGQLGLNDTYDRQIPTQVLGLTVGVTAISVGNRHICAVQYGAAKCWGHSNINFSNITVAGELILSATVNGILRGSELEDGIRTSVGGLESGVTAIAAGYYYSCAIQNGAAKCWGSNLIGQLGDNLASGRGGGGGRLADVVGLDSSVTAIAVGSGKGSHSTCAIQAGAAWCWGAGDFGQLGAGSTSNRATPVAVEKLSSGVTAVTVGKTHACAIQAGTAWCWGAGDSGQLGDGASTNRLTPVRVQGLDNGVTAIAAGGTHSCAIQNSRVKCWGADNLGAYSGQLGDGRASGRNRAGANTAVDVIGLTEGVGRVPAVPLPPTPQQLVSGEITRDSIGVRWLALNDEGIPPITAYRIYWDTVVGDEIESSAEITSPLQTSYTIEGLKSRHELSNQRCCGKPWWRRSTLRDT